MPQISESAAARLALDRPAVFADNIVAAVTQANFELEAPFGFQARQRPELPDGMAIRHRRALAQSLNIDPAVILLQSQVHGDVIQILKSDAGTTSTSFPLRESDGMISNARDIALGVIIADCAAVLLHDPVSASIGALHSGWRGTELGISSKGIQAMQQAFGAHSESMCAYVSACASQAQYEVGAEVAERFPAAVVENRAGKFFLDIRAQIVAQLQDCGISASNIEVSEACTIADKRYHSFRRDGQNSGRALAVIMQRS